MKHPSHKSIDIIKSRVDEKFLMVVQEKRLRARNTESQESLQRRLDRAKTEMREGQCVA